MADLKIKYKDLETAIKLFKRPIQKSWRTAYRSGYPIKKLSPICQVVRKN